MITRWKFPIEIHTIKAMLSTEGNRILTECFSEISKTMDHRINSLGNYLDDSDEAIESNSPEFPQPPQDIKTFKSGFFSFNFIIRG